MRRTLVLATLPIAFMGMAPAIASSPPQAPLHLLQNADVLPIALDDRYQFRKEMDFLNDPKYEKRTVDPMVAFERERVLYGAVTQLDRAATRGHYFNFFWRTRQIGPVTFRFEYRQANLGSYVQARELSYDKPKGTMETTFQIIGDDYNLDGRVIAWRAVLIAGGKIVALTQSFLWD